MALPKLRGHEEARRLLARAATRGGTAQSLLLHGPAGIGKERVGLWLAQLLVCETPGADEPCDQCLPCRLVLGLQHPDVHWFFPLPRPDGSTPERLREKLEEQRAGELQARRDDPARVTVHDRPPAHFLAAVQTIQRLASVRPSMGRRKVFVIGDADLMVPQESSPEAANAFLKVLEEPPADTILILTSSQPGALLPTIRSRVLPLRLGPIATPEVAAFLREDVAMDEEAAERVARLAGGAIGRALRLRSGEGPGSLAAQREEGRKLLLAALSTAPAQRMAAAHERSPAGARGGFLGEIEALAEWLRDLLAVASGAPEAVEDPDALRLLERAVERRSLRPEGVGAALDCVAEARELALGNVNPQLIVADLLRRARRAMLGEAA